MPDELQIPVVIADHQTPVVLTRRGPELAASHVTQLEEKLGYALPHDYREFLLKYNGGDPVVGVVNGRDDDPDTPYQHGDSISYFFKLPTAEKTVEKYEELRAPADIPFDRDAMDFPNDQLPIAEDGGGNLFILKLGTSKPLVRFWHHEEYYEPIENHRVLADNFLDLLLRIRSVEEQATIDVHEQQAELAAIRVGPFPAKLEPQVIAAETQYPMIRAWVRALTEQLFNEKGHFSIHADPTSRRLLDVACYLYQGLLQPPRLVRRNELERMIMTWWRDQDGGFGLTGHCRDFLLEWWDDRLAGGVLKGSKESAHLTDEAWQLLANELNSSIT